MILLVNTLILLGVISIHINNPSTTNLICVVIISISVGVLLSIHIIAKTFAQKKGEEGRQ